MGQSVMRNSYKFLTAIFLFLAIPFSFALTCNGGYSDTGINLSGEDWQAARLYRCNNTFSLEKIDSGFGVLNYYDGYQLQNHGATLDGGAQAILIPVSLPSKYRECNLKKVSFSARGNDASGFLKKNSFSSENALVNSLLTDWADDEHHRNCISSVLRPFGKHGLRSRAQYASGHEGYKCTNGNLKTAYLNNTKFSVMLQNTGDDGHGFFVDPKIYFYYARSDESCNGVDDDCDGDVDEGLSTQCGTTDVGECSYGTQSCSNGGWGSCSGAVYPANEICDGLDNDCDGDIDNGFECTLGSTNCEEDCTFSTRATEDCSGTYPSNSVTNYGGTGGKFTQTWDGSSWSPGIKNHYYNTTPGECAWECSSGYKYYEGGCVAEESTQEEACSGSLPANAEWNDFGSGTYTQQCTESGCSPSGLSAHYSETRENCAWKCSSGFHYGDGSCVTSERTAECDLSDYNGSLPPAAEWIDGGKNGYFVQEWSDGGWVPSSKDAVYSEAIAECHFACAEEERSCKLDSSVYCGAGTEYCVEGYWEGCTTGTAVACSENQYCDGSDCQFCGEGMKNCDLNLLNGCETDIMSDSQNCGECGNICETDQSCVSGECSGEPAGDLCEDVDCGPNSFCNESTGSCVCDAGYNNCDGSQANGCETVGACNPSPDGNEGDSEPECANDFECGEGEVCSNKKCVKATQNSGNGKCVISEDCAGDEYCLQGYCADLLCGGNYAAENHECVCTGTECNEKCFVEEGKCCEGNWNPGIKSCSYDTEDIMDRVKALGDEEAMLFIEQAEESINSGDVLKGKTEAMLADLRNSIVLSNRTDLEEKYLEAKAALEEGKYEEAQEFILSAEDEMGGNPGMMIIAIVLIAIAGIGGGVAYWHIKNRKDPEPPMEPLQ